ncbi:Hypothetical_protein [Hexamita inflata]|uniref:Hypothetical_protein n=1 Tax=Hexamita inflata TaxID=28002 RepID=A0AA86QHV1_9EUKA|nr:Hypothetical protein HINF_LOCUS44172 [Hexamita inflata]
MIYMQFSSILIYKTLTDVQINNKCNNQIINQNQTYQYCNKGNSINQLKIDSSLQVSGDNHYIFLYSNTAQNTQLRVQLKQTQYFAVFGFIVQQLLYNCLINVSIEFQIVNGALICQVCNIKVEKTTLIFIANGVTLSGLIYQAITSIKIHECSIQYRFNCNYSSGIVNYIANNIPTFIIVDVSLLGKNIFSYQISGYIASLINASTLINCTNLQVCTSEQEFGESNGGVHIIGSVIKDCQDACTTGIPTYGLCLEDLQYGSIVDYQNVCLDPFEFVNHTCVCKYGYILNQSKCVNVVDSLINLDQQLLQNISAVNYTIDSNFAILDGLLASNYSQLENQLNNTKQLLELNISALSEDSNANLKFKAQYLERMFSSNITQEKQLFVSLSTQLQYDCINNFTDINMKINNFQTMAQNNLKQNISILNSSIKSKYISLDDYIYQKSNQVQQYLNSSQQFSNSNRQNKINQLDKYIFDNVTKFTQYQAELLLSLSNRVAQTANYIKQNYSQLISYIQGTFANYDYLKAKCNPGSVCGSTTNYQKRDALCPEYSYQVHGTYPSTQQDGGPNSRKPCDFKITMNSGRFARLSCSTSGWYSTNSCAVPSSFKYGGSEEASKSDCSGSVNFPTVTVDLCQSTTVPKYRYFNEATWECSCV